YSESLFTEYYFGKAAGAQYVIGCRALIRNDRPIIGTYNVNRSGSSDMYYKGGNMLHTIRQLVGNDEKWRQLLRGMNKTFYHQTVTAAQIENYMIKESGINLKPVFDQYLRTTKIPVLEYRTTATGIQYRWTNTVPNFAMPVRICVNENGPYQTLKPTAQWQQLALPNVKTLTVDANYYVLCKPL
ncbi:MAG: M1 family peptidase, partial [Cytophagaceae bacterium]